jgi:glycosyltransferase involved in cell wall biosynthesis
MCELYPKYSARFSYIPNPVYERYFSPITNQDDGYVLNFGRQIEFKMGALLETARQMPGTEFVFVGSGDMVKEYGLPNVRFVGFRETVETYIDASAVCVFPSLSENFPLVGLEAMARGKPVIATHRGFSEYIQHMENGILLDSAEPTAISAAIARLMNDPALRSRLGESARITAQAYRPRHIVAQYMELYRSSRPSCISTFDAD